MAVGGRPEFCVHPIVITKSVLMATSSSMLPKNFTRRMLSSVHGKLKPRLKEVRTPLKWNTVLRVKDLPLNFSLHMSHSIRLFLSYRTCCWGNPLCTPSSPRWMSVRKCNVWRIMAKVCMKILRARVRFIRPDHCPMGYVCRPG